MARWKSETCRGRATGKPVTAFDTELAASDAAYALRFDTGKSFVPYRCRRCGHWHLAPQDRQTPCKPCPECRGQNGAAKQTYSSREDAERRAAIILEERGISLRAYECPYYSGWHLTSQS
jgi:hypothetical protein